MEKQFNVIIEENNFSDTIHRPIAEVLCKLFYNKYSLAGGLLNRETVESRNHVKILYYNYNQVILKENLLNAPK